MSIISPICGVKRSKYKSIGSLTAKNLINMGIVRKEKNGNRVVIQHNGDIYEITSLKDGQWKYYYFKRFNEAKSKFNQIYKSL